MNLAVKDIRHNLGRFALTSLGIGMLLMMVMGMVGIYRGMIEDAILLIDHVGADIWVVQNNTRGPFAEVSRVPKNLADRVAVVPGVTRAREFIYHMIQRERDGKPLRMGVVGLSWPLDKGVWLPLVAGRPLSQAHYEMVADITKRARRSCGRGSAAASIVSYALGITHVDPIKHNLFFERFLNLGRMDPPDIDVDFAWDERDQIIDYVFARYGNRYTGKNKEICIGLMQLKDLSQEAREAIVHEREKHGPFASFKDFLDRMGSPPPPVPGCEDFDQSGLL